MKSIVKGSFTLFHMEHMGEHKVHVLTSRYYGKVWISLKSQCAGDVLLEYIWISIYKCYKKVLISLKSQCAEVHTVTRQKSCTTQNNSISSPSSREWIPYIYDNIHIFNIHLWHEYEIWISCPTPCRKKWKWGFQSFTNTSCEGLQKYEELSTR